MILPYSILRPLFFRLDAERAHRIVFAALAPVEAVLERLPSRCPKSDPVLAQDVFGLHFANPIGLAAGFDKNADLPHIWPVLGFGFAELGTVTAEAQAGNPKPRLFRLPEARALINRMGFNNRGAAAVARRLARRLAHRRCAIPVGINVGKSRSAPLEDAATDYAASLRAVFPLADYVAVNVSSPNTPGLRDLQAEAQLAPLLSSLQHENERLAAAHGRGPLPVLVKLSPDLTDDSLQAAVETARRAGIAGLIATNTTVQRPAGVATYARAREAGGLSGAPLRSLSTRIISILHRAAGAALPIIGVGGIFTAEDAYEKIRAGASLLQVYTALVYEGPGLPGALCSGLVSLLQRDGFAHIREAVGCEA